MRKEEGTDEVEDDDGTETKLRAVAVGQGVRGLAMTTAT